MENGVLKIRELLGISSIDKDLYSIFFPRTEIPQSEVMFFRKATRDQESIALKIFSLLSDCHYIKSQVKKLELKKLKLCNNQKEFEFNLFVLDWKISEIIKIICENRETFSDYFGEKTNRDILQQIFTENSLNEGVISLNALKID